MTTKNHSLPKKKVVKKAAKKTTKKGAKIIPKSPTSLATNDTEADSNLSDANDYETCVDLMTMVKARDFAGILAAIHNDLDLAKAELVAGLGKRLIHLVAGIIPTDNELIPYRKLLLTLVLGRKVNDWHAENLMANDCFDRNALHFAAAAGNYEAINGLIFAYSAQMLA